MDKRWTIISCALLMVAAAGCRSARYRVQRYYRYPPPYYAPTSNVPQNVAKPAPVPKTTSPSPVTQKPTSGGPKPVAVPTHSASVATPTPAAVSPSDSEPKAKRKSFWSFFGSRRKTSAAAVATPASQKDAARAPVAGTPGKTSETKVESPATGVYRLKVGDPVIVYLRGIPGVPGGEQQIENLVGEDGCIQLPYINNINVLNMTATEAQEAVRRAYIDQQIYKQLTVNVIIPAKSYYIRGEVRQPGRYPLVGTVTVLQAIAAAGGYTEFASYSVDIVRGGRRISLNMRKVEKRSELDQAIEPGDIIVVNRSFF